MANWRTFWMNKLDIMEAGSILAVWNMALRRPLSFIYCCGIVLCFLPMILIFFNKGLTADGNIPTQYLYTQTLRDSIVASIAVSVLILIEILFDKQTKDFWPQWMILMFLLAPNAIIIFYIIPFGSVAEFGCLHFAMSIFFFHVAMHYLNQMGSIVWSFRSTLFLSISYNIASIATCMQSYSNLSSFYMQIFGIISLTLYSIDMIVLAYYYYKWIRYILKECNRRSLTYQENCCNLYLAILAILGVGGWIISVGLNNHSYDFIFTNYCLILFAAVVNTNHGRMLRKLEALSRVT